MATTGTSLIISKQLRGLLASSASQLRGIIGAQASLDENGLSGLLSQLGYRPSKEELRNIVDVMDANKDGRVAVAELLAFANGCAEEGNGGNELASSLHGFLLAEGSNALAPVFGGKELSLEQLAGRLDQLGLGATVENLKALLNVTAGSTGASTNTCSLTQLQAALKQPEFEKRLQRIMHAGAAILKERAREKGLRLKENTLKGLLTKAAKDENRLQHPQQQQQQQQQQFLSVSETALSSVLIDTCGLPLSKSDIRAVLSFADVDGSGTADIEEVVALALGDEDEEEDDEDEEEGPGGTRDQALVASASGPSENAALLASATQAAFDGLYAEASASGSEDTVSSWGSFTSTTNASFIALPYDGSALAMWSALERDNETLALVVGPDGRLSKASLLSRWGALSKGTNTLPATPWSRSLLPAVFAAFAAAGRVPISTLQPGIPSTAANGGGVPTSIVSGSVSGAMAGGQAGGTTASGLAVSPSELILASAAAAPATSAAVLGNGLGLAMDSRRLGQALAALGLPLLSAAQLNTLARKYSLERPVGIAGVAQSALPPGSPPSANNAMSLDFASFLRLVDEVVLSRFDEGLGGLHPLAEARIRSALKQFSRETGLSSLAGSSSLLGEIATGLSSKPIPLTRSALAVALHDGLRGAGLTLVEAVVLASLLPGLHQCEAASAVAQALSAATGGGNLAFKAPAAGTTASAGGAGGAAVLQAIPPHMRDSTASVQSAFAVGFPSKDAAAAAASAAGRPSTPDRGGGGGSDAGPLTSLVGRPATTAGAGAGVGGAGRLGTGISSGGGPYSLSSFASASTLLQVLSESCPTADVTVDGFVSWLKMAASCGASLDLASTASSSSSSSSIGGGGGTVVTMEIVRAPASLLNTPLGAAIQRQQVWYSALPASARLGLRKLCGLFLASPFPGPSTLLCALPSFNAAVPNAAASINPTGLLHVPLHSLLLHAPRLPISFRPSRLAPLAFVGPSLPSLVAGAAMSAPLLLDGGLEADSSNALLAGGSGLDVADANASLLAGAGNTDGLGVALRQSSVAPGAGSFAATASGVGFAAAAASALTPTGSAPGTPRAGGMTAALLPPPSPAPGFRATPHASSSSSGSTSPAASSASSSAAPTSASSASASASAGAQLTQQPAGLGVLRPVGAAATNVPTDQFWSAEGSLVRPGQAQPLTIIFELDNATGIPLPVDDALRTLVVGRLARVAIVDIAPAASSASSSSAGVGVGVGVGAGGLPTAAGGGGVPVAGKVKVLSNICVCPASWEATAEDEWQFTAASAERQDLAAASLGGASPGRGRGYGQSSPRSLSPMSAGASSPRGGGGGGGSGTGAYKASRLVLRCDAPREKGGAISGNAMVLVELNLLVGNPLAGSSAAGGSFSPSALASAGMQGASSAGGIMAAVVGEQPQQQNQNQAQAQQRALLCTAASTIADGYGYAASLGAAATGSSLALTATAGGGGAAPTSGGSGSAIGNGLGATTVVTEEVTCAWAAIPLSFLIQASAGTPGAPTSGLKFKLVGGSPGEPVEIATGDIYQRRASGIASAFGALSRALGGRRGSFADSNALAGAVGTAADAMAGPVTAASNNVNGNGRRVFAELGFNVKPLTKLTPQERQTLALLPMTAVVPVRQVRLIAGLRRFLARGLLSGPVLSHAGADATSALAAQQNAFPLNLRLPSSVALAVMNDALASTPGSASGAAGIASTLTAALEAELAATGSAATAALSGGVQKSLVLKSQAEASLASLLARSLPAVLHSGLGLGLPVDVMPASGAGGGGGGVAGSTKSITDPGLAGRGAMPLLIPQTLQQLQLQQQHQQQQQQTARAVSPTPGGRGVTAPSLGSAGGKMLEGPPTSPSRAAIVPAVNLVGYQHLVSSAVGGPTTATLSHSGLGQADAEAFISASLPALLTRWAAPGSGGPGVAAAAANANAILGASGGTAAQQQGVIINSVDAAALATAPLLLSADLLYAPM